MCSIVLITQQRDMNALIVAANRDEKLDRPAGDPRIDENSPIPRIRPVDEAQGGTWLGLNAMGVFAGITNRFMAPNDPTRSSRGSLPLLALEEPSARIAANKIASINPHTYNAFHLVMADAREAWVVWSDGSRMQRESLLPGVHVVTESSYGAGEDKRRDYLLTRVQDILGEKESTRLQSLGKLMGESRDDSFHGPCVHLPAIGYGTRSSSLVSWGKQTQSRRFLHSSVAPDQPQWQDYSGLIQAWG